MLLIWRALCCTVVRPPHTLVLQAALISVALKLRAFGAVCFILPFVLVLWGYLQLTVGELVGGLRVLSFWFVGSESG